MQINIEFISRDVYMYIHTVYMVAYYKNNK